MPPLRTSTRPARIHGSPAGPRPTRLITIWGERPKSDNEIWDTFGDSGEVGDFFDFTSGLANAYASDLLFGRGRQERSSSAYQFGHDTGDTAAMLTGLGEVESGF